MEYTFKNSLSARACTILLGEYQLTWQIAGKEKVIPYANITSIHLAKKGQTTYGIRVEALDSKPLWITNVYCLSSKETEDRSRQYVTFVRILHLHLANRSTAEFSTGLRPARLVASGVVGFVALVSAFLGVQFLAPGQINYFLAGTSVLLLALLGFLLLNRKWVPKFYMPSNIPLEFLP